MNDMETKYHVIPLWWLLSQDKAPLAFQSGWVLGTSYTSNGLDISYL